MKSIVQSLLPLAVLFTTALSAPVSAPAPAPAPASGASFPITDVLDTGLTIEEYAQQLEKKQVVERGSLTKRQYNGDTYNQLTDGTPCREISLFFARGTTSPGNVGAAGSEGPTFFNALASRLGGTSRLAIQGVNYPATIWGFLAGGDPGGSNTLYEQINTVASRCPSTKIVVSGYSQGAQLVHNAAQRLSSSIAARVNAVVTFGDADRDESFGPIPTSKVMIICHDGDNICDNGIIITPAHSNYEIDAPAAAAFVEGKL